MVTKGRDCSHRLPVPFAKKIYVHGGVSEPTPALRRWDKKGDHRMEDTLHFRVVAWWASGRSGTAKSNSAPNAIHFSSPPALGGLEGRWTPEDLLLCAVASCFTTTFRALAENSKFEYTDLQVDAEGAVRRAAVGYSFGEILIRARLVIPQEQERARGMKLLHKAEGLCLVARTLAVERRFEATIQVSEERADVAQVLSGSGKRGPV